MSIVCFAGKVAHFSSSMVCEAEMAKRCGVIWGVGLWYSVVNLTLVAQAAFWPCSQAY
jgi:hypothetical protein